MMHFAYGSNLNELDLNDWCDNNGYVHLKLQKVANVVLKNYRIDFVGHSEHRGGAIGTIVRTKGDSVYGVVFEVDDTQMKILDRKEGARGKNPSYKQRTVSVDVLGSHSKLKGVMTYKAMSRKYGAPSAAYLGIIEKGARDHGLPINWLRKLESFKHTRLHSGIAPA